MERRRPERLIEMGRVAGAHGVRGWIKVAPEGAAVDALVEAKEWWIAGEPFVVESARLHGDAALAQLGGVSTRERAQELRGSPVALPREALPEPEEGHYYLSDLVGLEVVNAQGEALGRVRRLFTNGAHDVMELVAGERTRLLPWVPAVVKAVDLPGRRIKVEWGSDW